MPRACVEGQSPSQGGGQGTSGRRDCPWIYAGMFLGIRSDMACLTAYFFDVYRAC